MFAKFKNRAEGEEIMDDFNLRGEELEQTLNVIENINNWLGGNDVLLSGVGKILKKITPLKQEKITILDAGCGSGDSLRALAKWGKKNDYHFNLIGVDANDFTIEIAKKKAKAYPEITFLTQDIFAKECNFQGIDIVVCGLFLHHLTEKEQLQFIQKCFASDVQSILINDLHRHWLGYYLFQLVCAVFRVPHMVKFDGSLSILKGFKRPELMNLLQKAGITNFKIRWKWAFRFEVIIWNQN